MGRNGKKQPVFTMLIDFVNRNVGKTVTSYELLLGKTPGRNAETAYLYKMIRLGYVKSANSKSVMDCKATYSVIKSFPPHYNSVKFENELKNIKRDEQ